GRSINLKTLALILKGIRVSGSWSQCMRKKTERGLSMNRTNSRSTRPSKAAETAALSKTLARGYGAAKIRQVLGVRRRCGALDSPRGCGPNAQTQGRGAPGLDRFWPDLPRAALG